MTTGMEPTETGSFQVMRGNDTLHIVLSSSLENIDRVDRETKIFLRQNGHEQEIFIICLGLREALTNAIRHGHHFELSKKVHFSLEIHGHRLVMEVEDQGEGFNWRAAQAKEPGLTADHGRGLAIIRKFFDAHGFNERGNKIVLFKALKA